MSGRWMKKPEGNCVLVKCADSRCNHTTVIQLGECDPQEARCTHNFAWDDWCDKLECRNCGLWIDGMMVPMLRVMGRQEFTKKHDELVKSLNDAKSELTTVLSENARLRRRLDGAR
jgi:hypothetical protein